MQYGPLSGTHPALLTLNRIAGSTCRGTVLDLANSPRIGPGYHQGHPLQDILRTLAEGAPVALSPIHLDQVPVSTCWYKAQVPDSHFT